MNENVCTVFAGVPIRYTKCTWERYCFSNSDLYSPFRFTLTFTYVRNCAKWVICNLHANKHRACRDARTCFGHRGHYSHSRYISYLVYFGYASYSEYVSTCVRELWTPWPAILANHTIEEWSQWEWLIQWECIVIEISDHDTQSIRVESEIRIRAACSIYIVFLCISPTQCILWWL